ncbi:hypothetical protein AA983_14225 [Dermacoccus sp. PE3]|nr:hypothetical protein AA983_14225 [Dermacoccus sp. PE3]
MARTASLSRPGRTSSGDGDANADVVPVRAVPSEAACAERDHGGAVALTVILDQRECQARAWRRPTSSSRA